MNKIVREHYPVEKLPEDLRRDLDPSRPVTLSIEQEDSPGEAPGSLTAILEEMRDRRISSADPVERVRALRAEWDRRDEYLERVRSGDAG